MPFQPYHTFRNRTRLERLIARYKNENRIPDDVHVDFHRYHPAFIHKLRSAKYNLDRLVETLTTTEITTAADTEGNFMFEVNMLIDGFFYNSGSALDILARVVLTLFGQPLRRNVYFWTAHEILDLSRPGDQILSRLITPPWQSIFSDYRNTLTHELILAPKYSINVDAAGAEQTYQIVFPLPDDPRAAPSERTHRSNPSVQKYATDNFKRILRTANVVYGDIADRARAQGSLPI